MQRNTLGIHRNCYASCLQERDQIYQDRHVSTIIQDTETSPAHNQEGIISCSYSLEKLSSYVYGQKVILRTDNAAVSWMTSLKNPTGHVAKWIEQLGSYDLDIRL